MYLAIVVMQLGCSIVNMVKVYWRYHMHDS
jgi:hypothetical protein